MTAKEAKNLADTKKIKDLDKNLEKIEVVAQSGEYMIKINSINSIVRDSLEELGYIVEYIGCGPRSDDESYYIISWA